MQIFTPRISLKEKLFFAEHLAVMLRSSIPIDRALSSLIEQTRNKGFLSILSALLEGVRKGEPLSAGLERYQKIFGEFFVSMVKAGECSGKLDQALRRLYEQMKKDYDLRSKVLGALTYPAFVLAAMALIGVIIMLVVMPKLIPMFQGFNTALPLPTRVLIGLSSFIADYFIWLMIFIIVSAVILVKLARGKCRFIWHKILLRIPGIGDLVKKVNIARFARTLSTLLSTDILVVDALNITGKIVGNACYKKALAETSNIVKQGTTIAQSLKAWPELFPATVETMIAVGEESGNLSDLLKDVAEFYEESVDQITKSISSIIEPALIVILGAAVAGIAMAILMPMYSLMEQI